MGLFIRKSCILRKDTRATLPFVIDFFSALIYNFIVMDKKNSSYVVGRDQLYTDKFKTEILPCLPAFCRDFFVGINMNTTVLTRYNYGMDLRVFFYYLTESDGPFYGKDPTKIDLDDMNAITSRDIERYLAFLGGYESPISKVYQQDSATSKARKFSSVRALFRYLYNNEMIDQNVTLRVSMPKIRDKAIIRLDDDEVSDVFQCLSEEDSFGDTRQNTYNQNNTKVRDTAIITLLLNTGIRVSECVGLNVDDLNFKNRSFLVHRKGGKQAILYFNDEVEEALTAYLIFREQTLKGKYIDPETIDALFLSTQLKRISVRAVEIMVKKYATQINCIKKITPHKLRSTYGTALYRRTKDIYVVAEVLGHNDINTTKKHYAAISEDIVKEASGKVSFGVNGSPSTPENNN